MWTLSSAQIGTGCAIFASIASRPAGSGCSISATPSSAAAAMFSSRLASVQPSFASRISRLFGAVSRRPGCARCRPRRRLDLEQRPPGIGARCAAIASGVPSESV